MPANTPTISAVWHAVPANIQALLAHSIHAGVEAYRKNTTAEGILNAPSPQLYFRADDIALPSASCKRMLRIFAEHDTPLALAVVPAWITHDHMKALLHSVPEKDHLWCWHQHGWAHCNNAASGKKCEFGNDRTLATCSGELIQGYERMQEVFGTAFYPLFTPPWNRISDGNIQILKDIGFRAISRYATAPYQTILQDIPIHVDLHTRKELSAAKGWQHMLQELTAGIASGSCGIMLHHERMNTAAENVLRQLLITLKSYPVQTVPINSYVV
ncbi:MAG: polysaccharide deacetylase family protein [Desulfovibrionales bacterium]|nr:polysaccharide deacetylase family protein [Desulfovibrionales bacterium]